MKEDNQMFRPVRQFFTADQMFGDDSAAEAREFESPDEMLDALVGGWNGVVGHDDVVWVLGNFTVAGCPPSAALMRALNGTKYLVAGPSDPVFMPNTQGEKQLAFRVARYREQGFKAVVTGRAIARRTGLPVTLPLRTRQDNLATPVSVSHFPYDLTEPERGEQDAYAPWRPKRPRSGSAPWLLHGHQAEWGVQKRQINVGVDCWGFEPVDVATVIALIEDADQSGVT